MQQATTYTTIALVSQSVTATSLRELQHANCICSGVRQGHLPGMTLHASWHGYALRLTCSILDVHVIYCMQNYKYKVIVSTPMVAFVF